MISSSATTCRGEPVAELVAKTIHAEYMAIVEETCLCTDSRAGTDVAAWKALKWNATSYMGQVKECFTGERGMVFAFKVRILVAVI